MVRQPVVKATGDCVVAIAQLVEHLVVVQGPRVQVPLATPIRSVDPFAGRRFVVSRTVS